MAFEMIDLIKAKRFWYNGTIVAFRGCSGVLDCTLLIEMKLILNVDVFAESSQ